MQSTDLIYGDNPRQKLDIYPSAGPNAPVIVFFHGGSWKTGAKETYKFVGKTLANMGYTAVLPNYRLYPEVKFPDFIDDGAQAVKWAQDNFPNRPLFLMGHSAGAYNAAMLAIDFRYLKKFGVDRENIRGFIGLSGPYDFTPRTDLKDIFSTANSALWNPVERVADPDIPVLLFHGRIDMVVKASNSISLDKKLKETGGDVQLHLILLAEHMLTIAPFLPGLSWLFGVRKSIEHFISSNLKIN